MDQDPNWNGVSSMNSWFWCRKSVKQKAIKNDSWFCFKQLAGWQRFVFVFLTWRKLEKKTWSLLTSDDNQSGRWTLRDWPKLVWGCLDFVFITRGMWESPLSLSSASWVKLQNIYSSVGSTKLNSIPLGITDNGNPSPYAVGLSYFTSRSCGMYLTEGMIS